MLNILILIVSTNKNTVQYITLALVLTVLLLNKMQAQCKHQWAVGKIVARHLASVQ
jgi:hypothetical protein